VTSIQNKQTRTIELLVDTSTTRKRVGKSVVEKFGYIPAVLFMETYGASMINRVTHRVTVEELYPPCDYWR
jgi:hypothetical protein